MRQTFKKEGIPWTTVLGGMAVVGVAFFGTLSLLPSPSQAKKPYTLEVPKPDSHRVDWISRHQIDAKQNSEVCQGCHTNNMFCIDCHERRDTVQKRVHRRNFRVTHSIQARANPRRCTACHTVDYCQDCHSGGGTSKR